MSRHLLIACLWLLLGACVTIAVAFACVAIAQLGPSSNIERLSGDEMKQLGTTHHPPGSQIMMATGGRLQHFGYEEMLLVSQARVQDARMFEPLIISEIDAGWPLFAFRRCDRTVDDHWKWRDLFAFEMVLGVEVASTKTDALLLPFRPVWGGIIVNTLFYAVVLWLLLAAPFAVRRMIRRRRGLCERCAYPIGVSPVCTECGASVRPRCASHVAKC